MTENRPPIRLAEYPKDEIEVGRGLAIAVGLHVFVGASICLIMFWLGIVSLKELLEKGGSLASSGPAPEQPMVEVRLIDIPPPPTDKIEFAIFKPKPPPPVPKPKPKPKKTPVKPVLKPAVITAPHGTGAGKSMLLSGLVVGTSGFPAPGYPEDAKEQHEEGTVRVHITFNAEGGAEDVEITGSSGVIVLDSNTRDFILEHWKNAGMANRSADVPVVYDLSGRSPVH